uniref:Uncharacterized protein n=1 Tax=uncultured marine group II/III euryarchaeote AD1000_26_F05 TaxID=1457744 RepID=A0A075FT97_9EURY|nr:hypothetical protein [uncultured marine group II/III euryarchaeote AD1000_26_F05]
MKPICNPWRGLLIEGRNKSTASNFHNSSPSGALNTNKRNSVEALDKEEGRIPGKIQVLITRAGNAEAIPAINQASASRRLVGNPIHFDEVAHQAKTGIENPIIHRGITSKMNNNMNSHSVDSLRANRVTNALVATVSENTNQTCL